MNLQDDVDNPDDPQSWFEVLKDNGIEIISVRENFDDLDILPNRVGANVLSQTFDPLLRFTPSNPMDEPLFGVDMAIIRRVLSGMEMALGEFRPMSPTPH
jgi:hypothetical protein